MFPEFQLNILLAISLIVQRGRSVTIVVLQFFFLPFQLFHNVLKINQRLSVLNWHETFLLKRREQLFFCEMCKSHCPPLKGENIWNWSSSFEPKVIYRISKAFQIEQILCLKLIIVTTKKTTLMSICESYISSALFVWIYRKRNFH